MTATHLYEGTKMPKQNVVQVIVNLAFADLIDSFSYDQIENNVLAALTSHASDIGLAPEDEDSEGTYTVGVQVSIPPVKVYEVQ